MSPGCAVCEPLAMAPRGFAHPDGDLCCWHAGLFFGLRLAYPNFTVRQFLQVIDRCPRMTLGTRDP